MNKFQIVASLAVLTALVAFGNQSVLKLKGNIGMAVSGTCLSLMAFAAGLFWPELEIRTDAWFNNIDFADTVFHGFLCFLLFAGAMHIDLRRLYQWKITVSLLTTVGVLLSSLVVAFSAHLMCRLVGVDIPFIWLLVFGALISPTDPVSVLALLRDLNAPKDLETKIGGESLLNDGTAIVLFSVFLGMALTPKEIQYADVAVLFAREALGGAALGVALGVAGNFLLRFVNDPPTEVLMTLAYALGGYALGEMLHVSAPLVTAVTGLIIGHYRHTSMEASTQERLVPFWEMVDELLNMVLFMLVGLAFLALPNSSQHLAFAGMAIICALLGRFVSVSVPLTLISKTLAPIPAGTTPAMVWGGVRGGVSLAMAMSLPESQYKPYLLAATWAVVMFSLLVQAPTMGWLLRRTGLVPPC